MTIERGLLVGLHQMVAEMREEIAALSQRFQKVEDTIQKLISDQAEQRSAVVAPPKRGRSRENGKMNAYLKPLNARRNSRGNRCYAEERSYSEEEKEDDEDEDEGEETESGSSSEMSGSEVASDEEGESDGEDSGDANDNTCFTCSSRGELLMCDFCPRSFHLQCHEPPLRRTPWGKFKCFICKDSKLAIGPSRAKSALLQGRGGSKATAKKSQRRHPTRSGQKRVHIAHSDNSNDEEVTVAKRGHSRRAAIESSSSESETTSESWEERNGRSLMRGKRAHSLSSQLPTKRCDQRSVSVSKDSGRRGGRNVQDLKALSDIIKDVLRHDSAWPFAAPVSLKEVLDYLEVVENPMDLGTIQNKLQRIEYDTCAAVLDDIQRVFINCDKYNQKSSEVGAEGATLERFFRKKLRRNLPEQSKYYKAMDKGGSGFFMQNWPSTFHFINYQRRSWGKPQDHLFNPSRSY